MKLVGKFNQVLMELSDESIVNAYKELKALTETGVFPVGAKYIKELADIRHSLYNDGRSLDNVRKELLDEIARRWYQEHKDGA